MCYRHELAAVLDKTAGAAMLYTAKGELASAKGSVEAAVTTLRQWMMDAEAGK